MWFYCKTTLRQLLITLNNNFGYRLYLDIFLSIIKHSVSCLSSLQVLFPHFLIQIFLSEHLNNVGVCGGGGMVCYIPGDTFISTGQGKYWENYIQINKLWWDEQQIIIISYPTWLYNIILIPVNCTVVWFGLVGYDLWR